MKAKSCTTFQYPSTRYSGSKRRLLPWLWNHMQSIQFDSVLDVFGGTASVSLMFKVHGKKVKYNDLLKSNQIIGKALIENKSITVTEQDLNLVFETNTRDYPDVIQTEFEGLFFTNEENTWLDRVVTNIHRLIDNEYKSAIIIACLFQACLSKRPYNLFHRANLYMRLADVERSFGNKVTWEKPFPEVIKFYVNEYNHAIFDNGKNNKVIGGKNALSAPNGVDLVYLDPPYFSQSQNQGTNYLNFYHFLEGIADYGNWINRIDQTKKHKPIYDVEEIQAFTDKRKIYSSFETMLKRYRNNIMVLSYRSDGIPRKEEIIEILTGLGKRVSIHEKSYQYALSANITEELIFIAE